MARRRSTTPKVKSRKKVNVALIDRMNSGKVTTPYRLMEELIDQHHQHLKGAKIAIAWRFGWKADADGRFTMGQAKKGSDLDRAMHEHDFVILLNHELWNAAGFNEPQMRALLDHELCHCQVCVDSNGEPKTDEKGRTVYRMRKHDVGEFYDVVARHGNWKDDLQRFAEAALASQADKRPLFEDNGKAESNGNGHLSNGKHKPTNRIKGKLPK